MSAPGTMHLPVDSTDDSSGPLRITLWFICGVYVRVCTCVLVSVRMCTGMLACACACMYRPEVDVRHLP